MHRSRLTLTALSIAVATLVVPTGPASAEQWLQEPDEAFRAAARRDVPVLVDLYAEWCGWCHKLEREVFSTPEFQTFASDYVLLRVDVEDRAEGLALQSRYSADELPTLLILTPENTLIGRVVGYHPTEAFLANIRRARDEFDAFEHGAEAIRAEGDFVALQRLATAYHGRADGVRARALYESFLTRDDVPDGERRWIEYLVADALRLEGRFGEAGERLQATRDAATRAGDSEVLAQLEELAWSLGRDRVDCPGLDALARFLEEYPESRMRPHARQLLETRSDRLEAQCA